MKKNSHPAQQHEKKKRNASPKQDQANEKSQSKADGERMMLLCVGSVNVGNRLGLTLAGKDTSTDGLADTDTETTGDGNEECSDEDLEPQSLLLANAAPPSVNAVATTGSGSSALGSLGSVLVAKSLLGGPHCAFFGTAIKAQSGSSGDGRYGGHLAWQVKI
jgi:hypothetical protein